MSNPAFDEAARRALVAVLDELVPPREDGSHVPGAGSLGVSSYVEEKLGDAATLIVGALASLDELARGRGADDFASLPAEDRAPLLREFDPQAPGFIASLQFHGYAGYYQNPRVMEAIGLPPRSPFPEGYELEAGDLSGLEAVRGRARLYREA